MLAWLAKYKVAVMVAALLGALGAGGAGVAAASGGLPKTLAVITGQHVRTASLVTTSPRPGRLTGRRLGARILTGTVIIYANGADTTYTVNVGQVTAASPSSITLKRADGSQVTLSATASTQWGQRATAPKDPAKLVGRRALVLSRNGVAMRIGGRGALRGAVHLDVTVLGMQGKTREVVIDRGTIQSASATQVSLKRADGQVVSEPVSAKARWFQAPRHTAIQPGQIASGARAVIVSANGSMVAARVWPATGGASAPSTSSVAN